MGAAQSAPFRWRCTLFTAAPGGAFSQKVARSFRLRLRENPLFLSWRTTGSFERRRWGSIIGFPIL
jgi:hypothetical protein